MKLKPQENLKQFTYRLRAAKALRLLAEGRKPQRLKEEYDRYLAWCQEKQVDPFSRMEEETWRPSLKA